MSASKHGDKIRQNSSPETLEEWIVLGIKRGWCSEVVCCTHDGLPSTAEENELWEQDMDPCVPAVRLYP